MLRLRLLRMHCFLLKLMLFVAALMLGGGNSAFAQIDDAEPSAEQREKQYAELAAESVHLQRQANVLRKAVQVARPTVVHIDSEHESAGRYPRRQVEEAGSGTIIEYHGRYYVLTNRHVVKDSRSDKIKIKLADGRIISPVRIWADLQTDVAVIAVDAPRLVSAHIGNSDEIDVGDFVLAVGSPFGLSHSVTFGIISAKGRWNLDGLSESVKYKDFMQTDAAINPGNSGGPLLNLKGEVVGMNTAIASSSGGSEGIGFTIPINVVMNVAKQLIDRDGNVVRAYLGVSLDHLFTTVAATNAGLSRQRGTRISGITANSPAQEAGLQVGDVVLQLNGIPIENDDHLINLVALTEVGREVELVVLRNRETLRIKVKVGDRSTFPQ
ncbi:MAG: trypsin-like peptidase domain-containing protein [Pirellulales bacterium]|nr:trypsin-like peptidase domain-containing protein [Pirellulales bacterium]